LTEDQKLKRANYHLWTFVTSKFISAFGNAVFVFGVSLYVLHLTGSAIGFAGNLICSVLPRVLLAPFTGYVVDRFSKKRIIILSQVGAAAVVLGLLLFSLANPINIIAIYITTALLSITSMFTGLTFTSSIANLIDENRIQKAMGFTQTTTSISVIGGPMVGGMLYGFVSFQAFLIIHIVSYTLAALLESTMNFKLYSKRQGGSSQSSEPMIQSMKNGLHYLRSQKVIWILVLTGLFINFFAVSIVVGLPFIIVEHLGVESEHFGIVEGMYAGGMLLASLYFSIRKKDLQFPLVVAKRGILLIAFLITATLFPIIVQMSYVGTVTYYITLALFYGITLTFINTPTGVLMQKTIDEEYRGRVFGLLETFAQALSPIGILIYGLLFDWIGPVATLIPTSLCLAGLTLFLLRKSNMKDVHHEFYIARGESGAISDQQLQTRQ